MSEQDTRQKIEELQDLIFQKVISAAGFDTPSPVGGARAIAIAPASDRVKTLVEILRVQPKYEAAVVNAVFAIPQRETQMECVEKLSPVFGTLSEYNKDRLQELATDILVRSHYPSQSEIEHAQKFYMIARDHMPFDAQLEHEDFTQFEQVNPTVFIYETPASIARKQVKDLSQEFDERREVENLLSAKSPSDVVRNIDERLKRLSNRDDFTKNDMLELRQCAYAMRRLAEQFGREDLQADREQERQAMLQRIASRRTAAERLRKGLDEPGKRARDADPRDLDQSPDAQRRQLVDSRTQRAANVQRQNYSR